MILVYLNEENFASFVRSCIIQYDKENTASEQQPCFTVFIPFQLSIYLGVHDQERYNQKYFIFLERGKEMVKTQNILGITLGV